MGGPTGTVTFLFTDVEGSTRLWEAAPDQMAGALGRHDEIVRSAIEAHGGYVFATGGDGFAVAFARAADAVSAALVAQAGLQSEPWPQPATIRARMAVHTGEVVERDGDYFGTAVNRAARLMALAHGGQVLASSVTAGLVEVEVPLVDLGEHRLRDLSTPQRVYQVGPGSFPLLQSADMVVGNLPVQLTSFIGRDDAVRDVVGMLGRERLVTLTGPGGVGKTRLGLQAAAEVASTFTDGAWLVELGGVTSDGDVPGAVAAVLRVPQQPGRSLWGSVCDACTYRNLLLVLDNCEHLAGSVAGLVAELASVATGTRVLMTSRQAVGVRGERLYPVAPMRADDEAVALFLDRAQAVKPGFAMTGTNALAAVAGGRVASRALTGRLLEQRLGAQETARARMGQEAYEQAVIAGTALTAATAMAYAFEVLDRLAPIEPSG